jgi:pullulanase/glycogen debranching enzyme
MLRVVMDVVYNHTAAAGQYGIDGFRFDLMGFGPGRQGIGVRRPFGHVHHTGTNDGGFHRAGMA